MKQSDPTVGTALATGGSTAATRLVIADQIHLWQQLEPAAGTTIQVDAAASGFEAAVIDALAGAGYGIQRVHSDQGAHLLVVERHRVEHGAESDADESTSPKRGFMQRLGGTSGEIVTVSTRIGAVELQRDYRITGDRVLPDSPMRIAGTRKSVNLDDRRFAVAGEPVDANAPSSMSTANANAVAFTTMEAPTGVGPAVQLITDELVQGVQDAATSGASRIALNSSRVEVPNLFFDTDSGFGALPGERRRVHREVVLFANDSLRLGREGKSQIALFIEDFRETTDVIALVGCSNGPTQLDIGNEGLALGRSQRVVEELESLGVPRASVFDEGCWAPVNAGDRFPSRGVVLELLRQDRT